MEAWAAPSESEGWVSPAFDNIFVRDIEGVGIIDEKIPVHVEAGSNARLGALGALKTVSGIGGDSARIYQSHRVEHRAAVLVQEHLIAHRVADDLQADALGFHSCRVRSITIPSIAVVSIKSSLMNRTPHSRTSVL